MKSKFITANVLLLSLISVFTPHVSQAMENSTYNLELDQPASEPKAKVLNSPIDITAKIITGPGYKAFLSYNSEVKPIYFTSTNSVAILNFGDIKPGEPLVRSNIITVAPGSAPGFQTVGYIDHALRSDIKAEIPSTSCDNGNCTNMLADTWNLPLTYGYGYRCDNIAGSACDMNGKDTYKRFSAQEAKEDPTTILYSRGTNKSSVEFSHKLNIPGNQTVAGYKNTLYLISSPVL